MSSKSIVLKRNDNDKAKFDALAALAPRLMVEYSTASQLSGMTTDFGSVDYLLVTGGHGNFVNGKPTQFNDADITSAKAWIGRMKGAFKAVILDTCFSSALVKSFLAFVPNGGCVVCAHGSSEGWTEAFATRNATKTVGSILAGVVDSSEWLGYASIGLAIKKPINQLLYTGNAGGNRGTGLSTRGGMGMDCDTSEELKVLDLYLARDGVQVVEATAKELQDLLKENLTMTVV